MLNRCTVWPGMCFSHIDTELWKGPHFAWKFAKSFIWCNKLMNQPKCHVTCGEHGVNLEWVTSTRKKERKLVNKQSCWDKNTITGTTTSAGSQSSSTSYINSSITFPSGPRAVFLFVALMAKNTVKQSKQREAFFITARMMKEEVEGLWDRWDGGLF